MHQTAWLAACLTLLLGASASAQTTFLSNDGFAHMNSVPAVTNNSTITVPGAPTRLIATANGQTIINLYWTTPVSNGGSPITGYRIEIFPNGVFNWTTLVADTTSTNTTYSHTGLAAGTTRYYRVSAINANGTGEPSNTAKVTTGAPPVPGAPTDLSATASGTTQIDLSWTAPADDGGSPITTYGIHVSPDGRTEWRTRAGNPNTTYSQIQLAPGTTRYYRVSAANAHGLSPFSNIASATTDTTGTGTSVPGGGGTDPPGGGGGGGGPRQTVPDAPTNLLADGGDEQVTLSWEAPENDGGLAITDYEVRINRRGSWISMGSTQTTHTVTGLVNGTVYVFQVRAVNGIGRSPASGPAEATPGVGALDFAHFANGASWQSGLVFVNGASHPIRPAVYFYDKEGDPIAAELVVDLTGDLEVQEDGALSVRSAMAPLGELTISTHGQVELVSGSVTVSANGPIGGVLRYAHPDIGVAGVGVGQPVRDALFPARRQAGGISTAAALHNLGEEAMTVSCRLMKDGNVLEEVEIYLAVNGQEARYIEEVFTLTDTSDFVGSVRCTAPDLFTGVAVEIDAENRILTTLPVVPVARAGGGGQETVLNFAHSANGNGTTSDLVFVNVSTRPSGPGPTPFHTVIRPTRPVLYFYDQGG